MNAKNPQDNRIQIIVQEIIRRTNDQGRRIRIVEDKIQTIEDRMNSLEENIIRKSKKTNERFTDNEVDLKNIKNSLIRLDNNLDRINKQIKNFARKRDIKELERMFELLNPIRQEFVTRKEIDKIN